jgi:hypothetical protein
VNFGLIVKGRKYSFLCHIQQNPLTLKLYEGSLAFGSEPTAPAEDLAKLPPIQPIVEGQTVVEWRTPDLIEVVSTTSREGELHDRFNIGGEELLVTAKVMDRGYGTPVLRQGVRKALGQRPSDDGSSEYSAAANASAALEDEDE